MTDLKAIRAAAEAATPGPWQQISGVLYDKDFSEVCAAGYGIGLGQADARYWSNCKRKANGDFLKQIDPATILALLDRLEAAEKDAARIDWLEKTCSTAKTSTGLRRSPAPNSICGCCFPQLVFKVLPV